MKKVKIELDGCKLNNFLVLGCTCLILLAVGVATFLIISNLDSGDSVCEESITLFEIDWIEVIRDEDAHSVTGWLCKEDVEVSDYRNARGGRIYFEANYGEGRGHSSLCAIKRRVCK